MLSRIVTRLPEPRDLFWTVLKRCIAINPQSARWLVGLFALYLHLGPFSRYVVSKIDEKNDELAAGEIDPRARQYPAVIANAALRSN